MNSMAIGLGVFVLFAVVTYGAAWLAPEPRSDAELDAIRSERGSRVAERFRQMDEQRRLTLKVGRVVLPVAIGLFVIAVVADLLA